MTVQQLLHNISSEEISEWMAYYKIEYENKKAALDRSKSMMHLKHHKRGR